MIEPYIATLLALGALILLVAWTPLGIKKLPLSLPIICVALGYAAFSTPFVVVRAEPFWHMDLVERVTEFVVIIALMGAGLKIDRPFGWRGWNLTWRLLAITMPLSIAAIAVVGVWGGLSVAGALLLAAALAPTDPVLASDVQVGPPRSGEEDEVRFALTSEAGLNDGLAFPFVNLAVAMAAAGAFGAQEFAGWFGYDVLWKLSAGAAVGALVGYGLGWLTFRLPGRTRLSSTGDGFVAIGATLIAYAATEAVHGYGFLAVFVSALALRHSERDHDYHATLHDFVEQTERLLIMLVLVFFGGALAHGILGPVGWAEVGFALLILLVIRPATGFLGLIGTRRPLLEKALIAFFGIRGIGTLYYLAYAVTEERFPEAQRIWAVASLVILFSVLLHGVTSTPLMKLMDRHKPTTPAPSPPSLEEGGQDPAKA
jgi:NhaP-type Na+/H+ or K+/H+ antiporter